MSGEQIQQLCRNIEKVLIGKEEAIKMVVVGLLAHGHILIEDVPGVGKTTLAQALAKSLDCSFRRIQFTPDLLPSDILGVSIYNPHKGNFEFKPGPIFANIVLADEINRATPRTQSSLLEAMNEFQVSLDGTTYPLPAPFMVLATQNPLEYEGTYPLPESQLDRFLLKVKIGYPSLADEKRVLAAQKLYHPLDTLRPVLNAAEVVALQEEVRQIRVDDSLVDYLMSIVSQTRESKKLAVGVSPRGSLALYRGAQALALVEGRHYCIPDDIKRLAVPILSQRVIGNSFSDHDAAEVIEEILHQTPVPL